MSDENKSKSIPAAGQGNSEPVKRTAIILAAGKGTRMKSPLPKVLHPVAGRPMIEKIISACRAAGFSDIRVVVGHGQNLVRQVTQGLGVNCYVQNEQLGTADAVKAAQLETLEGEVMILNGDHPLIQPDDLKNIFRVFHDEKLELAVVSCKVKKPKEFGRIIRHKGDLVAIVEAKDASAETLKINEINTGFYVAKADILKEYLPQIKNNNLKKEFYLTDIIQLCIENHVKTQAILGSKRMAVGVNSQLELSQATQYVYRRKALQLMEAGVMMMDPSSTYIEETVDVGPGSVIYPNVFLRGQTKVGSFSVVESHSFISDSLIGDSVQIRAGSYLERAQVHNKASVGPYARLRPETQIGEEAHVGNFVEMKKVRFGKKSKAGHLTYLGDAEIGEEVNVGCGTITCNYAVDKKKYVTKIGDRVFIGSDSQFVAPVQVGDDAIIASGSTITEDVPDRALAIARGKQYNKENYADEVKRRQEQHSSEEKSE